MDHTVAYFNLDMVGMGTVLDAPGALNFPTIWDVIRRDQDEKIMKQVEPGTGGPGGSDHSAFIRRGIEALALMTHGGVGHPDYHQPEDDREKIDPEMLRVTGQFVLQGLMNLADETSVNLLIARRKELYEGLRMRVANYNPALEGSSWTLVDLQADSSEALQQEIYNLVRETIKKGSAPRFVRRRPSDSSAETIDQSGAGQSQGGWHRSSSCWIWSSIFMVSAGSTWQTDDRALVPRGAADGRWPETDPRWNNARL